MLDGFTAGVISSFLAWLVVSRAFRPRLRFSKCVARVPSRAPSDSPIYKVKIQNSGLWSAVDLEIVASLRVRGLSQGTLAVFSIPVDLDGGLSNRIAVLKSVRWGRERRRLIGIYPDERRDFFLGQQRFNALPGGFRTGSPLRLEDLLKLGTEAWLRIEVFSFDGFSGTRRVSKSPDYRLSDIVEGRFRKESLELARGGRLGGRH